MTALDPLAAFRLDGRVALVTGARREIGRAIALGLGALGARVAVHHIGTAEEEADAARVVAELAAFGTEGRSFAADFAAPGAGRALAAAVTESFGPVDILVLNASIEITQDWTTIDAAAFDRQVTVNLHATLDLLQSLVPAMGERGWGRVLTIGSIQQEQPHPGMLVYSGSKAMQHNWAISLARQLGGRGVTVNNLAPGFIATARNVDQQAQGTERVIARTPVGRLGRADDLVGAAVLLCSDAGSYITGENLFVDGGRHVS